MSNTLAADPWVEEPIAKASKVGFIGDVATKLLMYAHTHTQSFSCSQEQLGPISPITQGLMAPSLVDHKDGVALSHELAGR